jgi:hypothetical protein
MTVVERMRLPSPRSSGWAELSEEMEGDFEGVVGVAEEEKYGFIGTPQYIACFAKQVYRSGPVAWRPGRLDIFFWRRKRPARAAVTS